MPLSPQDFGYVADLARKNAAIVLEPGKEYLVEARLQPLADKEGFTKLEDYIAKLREEIGFSPNHAKVVDALTTNETFFFRDIHPFEALRTDILPGLIARRAPQRRLSIWCAAASTGQEPYSIAMLLEEHFPKALEGWNVSIIATDYSERVLDQARRAEYNQVEVNRGLPAIYLVKYFRKQSDRWAIRDDIRKRVEFRRLNLIESWPLLPQFDIVFMRNVLIYFAVPVKQSIMRNVRKVLAPDGYYALGSAETTMNIDSAFLPMMYGRSTFYRTQLNPR
ncbi:MAG: protein-glutamate O-methyltransferase CheR [Opitutaceae bacterium]|nr:protein-glutamate O-methyltransferase CheR [Opitutaceae bacterium]